MDPVDVVHTEMAGAEVMEDVGVDLDRQVSHCRIHRRIDKDCDLHVDLVADYFHAGGSQCVRRSMTCSV